MPISEGAEQPLRNSGDAQRIGSTAVAQVLEDLASCPVEPQLSEFFGDM